MKILTLSTLLLCLLENELATALKLPGPLVYVVTPSPRPLTIDEGRSAPQPFYYHNWMRRMDLPISTTTTSTTTPRVKTPDLIFAEFESDKRKNIRKLLEKERVNTMTSTTTKPIYVLDEIMHEQPQNYGLPAPTTEREDMKTSVKNVTDYFALYNSMYNSADNLPAPVPSSSSSTLKSTTTPYSETPTPMNNMGHIWHIIDSEKHNQYNGGWNEVPIGMHDQNGKQDAEPEYSHQETQEQIDEDDKADQIDNNFALPGFSSNSVKGADNESRAIRTESNIRYPYVNLQPFQMKNLKKPPMNSNGKKGNNIYTNLDNFYDIKNPVRGEAQDIVYLRQPIDRYNAAQPYLPSQKGSKSKQSSPSSTPSKTAANLVPPPPPPPPPKASADDFPAPVSYDSFPPYAPSAPDTDPPPISKPSMSISPSVPDIDDDSFSDPGGVDLGYQYKPTLTSLSKPFGGYSYNKPMTGDTPPSMETDDHPEFGGYHYEKPAPSKPDFQGYHYSKPEAAAPPAYDPPAFEHGSQSHESDYPEFIFDKPDSGKGGDKDANDMKDDDIGMVPPPPASDMMKPGMNGPSMDDSGFPHDIPGDLKFYHDDHDFYHHHHHHPTTTTTTTTEMPRVNRYSYYYLGKKLYYLPLYFSVYFIVYVGALVIKAVLRHKIVYPNSYRPNSDTASYFSKRSVGSEELSDERLHEITSKVTHAIAIAAERYIKNKDTKGD